MSRIDFKNCTLKIKDGSSNSVTVKFGEGNFTYTTTKEMNYYPDRGILDDVVEGDQVPMDVSFEGVWEYIRSPATTAAPTVEEALKKIGGAADWVSTDDDDCRPYAVDLEFENDPNCSADTETLTFPDFRCETVEHDASANTLSFSGKCNAIEPTSVRT